MTIDQLHDLLLLWGRWAQSGIPMPTCQISPIFQQWIPSQYWKDLGEAAPAGVDVLEAEPDDNECYELEKVINGLQARHKRWLIARYVKEQYVDTLMLNAAQRALMDRL